MSFIYIIGNDTTFKIGFTSDCDRRLKQLQTGNSQILNLLWARERDDAVKLEKYLHTRFAEYRLVGEWFDGTRLDFNRVIAESFNYIESDW